MNNLQRELHEECFWLFKQGLIDYVDYVNQFVIIMYMEF